MTEVLVILCATGAGVEMYSAITCMKKKQWGWVWVHLLACAAAAAAALIIGRNIS